MSTQVVKDVGDHGCEEGTVRWENTQGNTIRG